MTAISAISAQRRRMIWVGRRRSGGAMMAKRPKDEQSDQQGQVRALDRGLQLLREISARDQASTAELVRATGIPLPTAHRLLTTLEANGFVARDPDIDGWLVGVEAF